MDTNTIHVEVDGDDSAVVAVSTMLERMPPSFIGGGIGIGIGGRMGSNHQDQVNAAVTLPPPPPPPFTVNVNKASPLLFDTDAKDFIKYEMSLSLSSSASASLSLVAAEK